MYMADLVLRAMDDQQFQDFFSSQTQEYAQQKMLNHAWTKQEAQFRAEEEFKLLLPDQQHTYHNFLYVVQQAEQTVGYVWLAEVMDGDYSARPYLFLYDFAILNDFQDQGFGQKALNLVIQQAHDLGYQELGLHVFGINQKAQHLYHKLGFQVTDVTMKRSV